MADDESRIITLDDERAKRNPKNRMQDYCTREEMVTSATTAALGVGQKVYEEIAAEHAEQFEKLEHVLWQKMLAELEARSLRGKLRQLWQWWCSVTVPPSTIVDPWRDALDPAVHQAAHERFVAQDDTRYAAMTPEEYAPKAP